MLAVQRPPPTHSFSAVARPGHCRAPSAPVVVRPTHTPGLLSLSKPAVPRQQQQQQQQQRQQRPSPRGKPHQRSPQPAPATAQAPAPKADAPAEKAKQTPTPAPTADKLARGRQSAKDKAQRRSSSLSAPRGSARRPSHQPSPPPSTRIPSQAEAPTQQRPKLTIARSSESRDANSNLSDPFVTTASHTDAQGKDASLSKAGPKAPSYRSPPKLATHPTGKLARRRQQAPQSTPSKAVPVPRVKGTDAKAAARSEPAFGVVRPQVPRASSGLPIADFESFPICDDSSDMADDSDETPPTTPIRETASVPFKKHAQWQANRVFDNAPRTAPLSSTFAYPFVPPSPVGTPTPAQRRRVHRRVPSEGVFNMSMDEDSSSSSEMFDVHQRSPVPLPKRRAQPASEPHSVSGSPAAGFYAGSMFQNSPSPDALPAPSF